MSAGRVQYAEYQGVQALRFVGDIRYTQGPALDRFLKQLCAGSAPRGFVIDLTQTESLDSTSLGLLARVAKWMRGAGGTRATLVSNNEDINDLLFAVGFDEVFDIVPASLETHGLGEALEFEESVGPDLRATVLEAHRTLRALNARNREEFRDVVSLLEAEEVS